MPSNCTERSQAWPPLPVTTALWEAETRGSSGLAGYQLISRWVRKPCPEGIRGIGLEQDTLHAFLTTVFTCIYIHAQTPPTYMTHILSQKNKIKWIPWICRHTIHQVYSSLWGTLPWSCPIITIQCMISELKSEEKKKDQELSYFY